MLDPLKGRKGLAFIIIIKQLSLWYSSSKLRSREYELMVNNLSNKLAVIISTLCWSYLISHGLIRKDC